MRILVVGKAALGEIVTDRLTPPMVDDDGNVIHPGRPRHIIDVLTDEDMRGPHEVFTCGLFHMAVRYLGGLEFDAIFLDGPLGEQLAAWLQEHADQIAHKPRILIFSGPQSIQAIGGFDVAAVTPISAVLAGRIRETLAR